MGSLADAVFHFLFGWVKDLFRSLWRVLFQSGGAAGEYASLSRSWLRWGLLLCLVCTVIEVTVHLFRWRPLEVWAGFFRRLRGEGVEAEQLAQPEPEPEPEEPPEDLSALQYEEPLYAEEYVPPADADSAGAFVPEAEELPEAAPAHPGLLHRIAAKTRELTIGDEADPDLMLRSKPEPLPVRPEEAYGQPVYPPSWKNER